MASGVYELDSNGIRCFRPFLPTPPAIERVFYILDDASASVRIFDRRLQEWSSPHAAGRLFARLDAVCSAGAEGSTTTFTDLLEYESSLRTAPDVEDAASVAALANASSEAASDDVLATMLRLHRRLFENAEPRKALDAGKLKTRANRTVDPEAPGGFFAYTRSESVRSALTEWSDFVSSASPTVPEPVRQCLGHWMFEHIHPLTDGNGRVGRLLIPMVLREKGFTQATAAYVSEPIYDDKELYVESLKHARISGEMLGFARLMLGFMAQAAKANLARLDRMEALRTEWKRTTVEIRSDSALHRLRDYALTKPAFTITDAVSDIDGTFASVNEAAKKLVDLGILSVAKGKRRDRLFQAPEVLDIFDHFRAHKNDQGTDRSV
jgi:Fic family protein